jgi:hypothetical protein
VLCTCNVKNRVSPGGGAVTKFCKSMHAYVVRYVELLMHAAVLLLPSNDSSWMPARHGRMHKSCSAAVGVLAGGGGDLGRERSPFWVYVMQQVDHQHRLQPRHLVSWRSQAAACKHRWLQAHPACLPAGLSADGKHRLRCLRHCKTAGPGAWPEPCLSTCSK